MNLQALLSSFSIAIVTIAACGLLPTSLHDRPRGASAILGLVMGLGTIGCLLTPMQVLPGVFYDMRVPLLTAAGFMGGPVTAAIAAAFALTCRLWLGGVGVWAGCHSVVMAAAVGTLAFRFKRPNRKSIGWVTLLAASAVILTLPSFLLLPREFWGIAIRATLPGTALSFACTWLFILSLERDEAHRALIKRNIIYRAIIETLPDSLNAKDRDSRFTAANPATARLMGAASAEDLIGRSDMDFYPEAMARLFREEEVTVLHGKTIGPLDQEVEMADGSRRWLTTLKTPLHDKHGEVCGIITHNRDMTDRKRLEADLRTTQGYLHEAMANMADGLVLYDKAGEIRFCNQQYRNLFPKTADLRIPGAHFADIMREAARRGEQDPVGDVEDWIDQCLQALHIHQDRVIALHDGRFIEARTRPIAGSDILVIFADITSRKQMERELLRRASHDPLTNLPNRAEFDFQLDAAYQNASVDLTELAVMMLDLDRFKQVNDTLGHAAGDKLLIEVATRIRAVVRSGDIVARLGGDEFAFVISAQNAETACIGLAERVLQTMAQPVQLGASELFIQASLGMAFYPKDTTDPRELLILADQALYAAKAKGGSRWAAQVPNQEGAPLEKAEPRLSAA